MGKQSSIGNNAQNTLNDDNSRVEVLADFRWSDTLSTILPKSQIIKITKETSKGA